MTFYLCQVLGIAYKSLKFPYGLVKTLLKNLHVYVHIPFCVLKCAYCDFLSFDNFTPESCEAYIRSLLVQIRVNAETYRDYIVRTIFIGGGTPTVIPSRYISEIIREIRSGYNICDAPEVTVEANPESAAKSKLEDYIKSGINRISIGAQSFNDKILGLIGRAHNADEFFKCFDSARKAGFCNINIDIIFGLPHQSQKIFANTLKSAVILNPEHISCYGLIVEEGTPLYFWENPCLPSEDTEYEMYSSARQYLTENGYNQYEISNYAKPGIESRHNLAYWSNGEYVGFGLGAHSYISGIRFHNTRDLSEFISGDFSRMNIQKLTPEEMYAEYMFLGMRKIRGISEMRFYETFGVSVQEIYGKIIDKHLKNGLIESSNGRIYLSEKGVYISNAVFSDFV